MRKARYDLRKVTCPNSSHIGHSTNVARPGSWILTCTGQTARVLGRVAETDDPNDCVGFLAVMTLYARSAGIFWIDPYDVRECYDTPPVKLLDWLTSPDWVGSKHDIHRIIAMGEHGTLQEQFIATRHDPDKAYNARPEYVAQFILSD